MYGVFLSLNQGCYKDKTKANVVLITKYIMPHMRVMIYGYDIETMNESIQLNIISIIKIWIYIY